MDAIAALQGKSIPSGSIIAGFGPSDPPSPPDIPTARQMYGDPIEPAYDDDPDDARDEQREGGDLRDVIRSSPLIPVRRSPEAKPFAVETPDLTVLGTHAAFRDQEVTLLATEAAQIQKVVLRAIQRVVLSRMAEVEKLLPRRGAGAKTTKRPGEPRATPSGVRVPGGNAGSIPAPAPKRRGRPPKVKA